MSPLLSSFGKSNPFPIPESSVLFGSLSLAMIDTESYRFLDDYKWILQVKIREQAWIYLSIKPGYARHPSNVSIHSLCYRIAELDGGQSLTNQELLTVAHTLEYRLCMTERATWFKEYLGIKYPDCAAVDAEEEFAKLYYFGGVRTMVRLWRIYRLVNEWLPELFKRPIGLQGKPFEKLVWYMCLALHSTGKDLWVVLGQLHTLAEIAGRYTSWRYLGSAAWRDELVEKKRQTFKRCRVEDGWDERPRKRVRACAPCVSFRASSSESW